ncbi:MAG: PfkB family carbohydrate kinase [bacterium]|nr:PfkB family carbohydrate kinase [bacterium]
MHPIIDQMKGRRVIVFGDVVLDHYVWGEVERISPEAPVPVVRVQHENDMPGAAANVAMNLAALDARAIMIGVIGDDPDGQRLRDLLQQQNVDCTYLLTAPGTRTTRKTRIIARNQHVVRVDWDTILPPDVVRKSGAINALERALPACDAVIIQDYHKGLILPTLFDHVKCISQPVIVDPNRYHNITYRGMIATPNLEEARILSGVACSSSDALAYLNEIARGFFARHEVEHLLITLGDKGIALCERDGTVRRRPAAKTHSVYDVSGAGDTVCAVLAAAVATGAPLWHACQLANIAGAIVVGKMGTATTSRAELQELLDTVGLVD